MTIEISLLKISHKKRKITDSPNSDFSRKKFCQYL